VSDGHPTGAVVIIPVFDGADTVGATVEALGVYLPTGDHPSAGLIREIVVVDDGSRDHSADIARSAGARVIVLPRNVGKGGAVAVGRTEAGVADQYLLLDADLGMSAGLAVDLLAPVVAGEASMAVAVFPETGRSRGFGLVGRFAAGAIGEVTGRCPVEPLSGQRAIEGTLFRDLDLAPRFGLEVAMSIDVWEAGGSIVELPLDLVHRATGRDVAGFRHRFGQGVDVMRAVVARRGPMFAARQVVSAVATVRRAGRA